MIQLVYEAKPVLDALGDNPVVIIDTETSSKYPHRDGKILAGVGVKPLGGPSFYMPVRHKDSQNASLRTMRGLMEELRGLTQIYHHPKFDLAVLFNDGVDFLDEDVLDTVVMTRLTYEDEVNYELKRLGKRFIKDDAGELEKELKRLMKERGWTSYDQIPAEMILAYVGEDLELTEGLFKLTTPLINKRGLAPLLKLEQRVTRTLFYMEQHGFLMDRDYIEGPEGRDGVRKGGEHKGILTMIESEKKEIYRIAGRSLRKRLKELDPELDEAERARTEAGLRLYKDSGNTFNHNSAPELKKVFNGLGVHSPVMTSGGKKKKQPQESWAKDALAKIDHPMADMIAKLRGMENIEHYYAGFMEMMDANDVIHCSIHQAGAKTGRCSCREPNFQNIPKFAGFSGGRGKGGARSMQRLQRKGAGDDELVLDEELSAEFASELEGELIGKVRGAFIPRPGCFLLICDWSQIELRILADYANALMMLRAFELGIDIHKLTAQAAYGALPKDAPKSLYEWWRGMGKDLNFGLVFGMGVALLATKISRSKEEAQEFMDRFFATFPEVKDFIDNVPRVCMEQDRLRVHKRRWGKELGWVSNKWGRRRYLPEDIVYRAVNFLIQGTAADLLKDALARIHEAIHDKFKTKFLLTVHDEIIFEVPYEEAGTVIPVIMEQMGKSDKLRVEPLVDVDWSPTRWSEKVTLACKTCKGKGKVVDVDEDTLLDALYRRKEKVLNAAQVTTCGSCGGDGYDLSLIERPAA